MKHSIFIILSLVPFMLLGQLSFSVETVDPTCASNGQITVTASGGSGDYQYSLTYNCGELILPQASNLFTTLPPCAYTVIVTDQSTGESTDEQVTLSPMYERMELEVTHVGCDLMVNVSGSAMPYTYAYSTIGETGPFINNQPANSGLFIGLEDEIVWFEVIDNCGNNAIIQTNTTDADIYDFDHSQLTEGLQITVDGGFPPYLFEMTSEIGTFNNNTGLFPWDQVGCNPRITIHDQCMGSELINKLVDIHTRGRVDCVSFSEGTAVVTPTSGIPPFTYSVETPAGTFTFDDGNITGLPQNVAYYNFFIADNCGNRDDVHSTTRYQLDLEPTTNGCSDDEIVFKIDRQCTGTMNPILVTCLNCSDQETAEVSFFFQEIEFSGYLPGEWDLLIVDVNCEDTIRCQDELIVELTTACDSILALVVDRFNCDNGIENRRVIYDTTAIFSIRDENGLLIEEGNTTGVFHNLPLGTYEVTAYLDCDTLTSQATLSEAITINPYFETRIRYNDNNSSDSCQFSYSFRIEKTQGPFLLSANDGSYSEVLNNYGQDNCRFYGAGPILPGTYTLASLSRCGEITLELPELPFNELGTVDILSNCPSGSRIEVNGTLRSTSQWRSLLAPYNLNIKDLDKGDKYKINGQFYTSNIISDLPSGDHTLYLHPLNSYSCPVDSISFFIPEYLPVELETVGNILCDNSDQTDLTVMISKGNAPYQFSEIDCNNPSIRLFTQTIDSTSEQVILQNRPLGIYCFVVRDGCSISSDYQEEVRYYEDDIEVAYTCDSTILLNVDSVNVPIFWRNQNQEIIGMGASLVQAAPGVDAVFSVAVELPACTIDRQVLIPARTIIPSLAITPSILDTFILCGEESVELILETDAIDINWNTGDNTPSLLVSETGQYSVEVTNDIGCIQVDSVNVLKVALPTPEIIALDEFCEGDSLILNLNQTYPTMLWSNNSEVDSLVITEGGSYSINVSNEYGCLQMDSIEVTKWNLPVFSLEGEQTICPNTSTLIQPDSTFVSYEWNTEENTPSINAFAGNYQVTVTDEHSCENTDSINIQEFPQINAQLQGDTLICEGEEASFQFNLTGSTQSAIVTVGMNDGTLLPSFNLTPNDTFNAVFNQSSILTIHSIQVDNYNCPIEFEGQANVTVPPLPTPNIISPEGFCDGTSTILTLSQAYPSIIWSNAIDTDSLIISEEGEYTVEVIDQYGCSQRDTAFLTQWALPTVNIQGDLFICPNTSTLLETISSFQSYSWSTGENTPSINVFAESYHLTVTDEHSCENTDSINIQEFPQIIVQLQGDTLICKDDEASIQFIMEGSNLLANLVVETQVNGEQFSFELLPNQYFNLPFSTSSLVNIQTITVDSYNCPIDITEQANIRVTNESSNFEMTDTTCPGGSDGGVLASTISQSPPFQYNWSNGSQGELLSNLAAGIYYVTITDSLNCNWTDSVFITSPPPIEPSVFVDNPICHNETNGLIAMDHILGGTPPFTIFLNDNEQISIPYENATLDYGTYQISLTDVNNCPWDTTITLINPPLLEVTLGEDQEIKLGDSITLIAQPNLPNIDRWQWENLSFSENLEPIFSNNIRPFETSIYHVLIESAVGCIAEDWITVFVDKNTGVFIPNVFSPNHDGVNDHFEIFTNNSVKEIKNFQIFTRWGEQVFQRSNSILVWDGKFKEQESPTGVYVYLVEVEVIDGTTRLYKGDVLLLR